MSSSWLEKADISGTPALLCLLALGLGLRVWGLDFGLPLLSNFYIRPDETLLVVPAVEFFARHGHPGHLNYPALMIQVLGVLFQAVHGTCLLLGSARSTLLEDFGQNPSRYFLAARVLSALCGSAAILLVHRLARRWCNGLPALIAAAWYAVSPLAVREAHFAVTDTALSLLAAGTVLAAVKYFEVTPAHRRKALIWCGCLCGMSLATKYVAGLLVPALLFAFLAGQKAPRRADLLIFLACALGIFCLLNPWLLLHPRDFLDWMQTIFRAVYDHRPGGIPGARGQRGWSRAWMYLGFLPGRWLGALVALLGLGVGIRHSWQDRAGPRIALLAVTLAFVALLAPARTLPFRYLAPLLPLMAVLAGMGLLVVWEAFGAWTCLVVGLLGLLGTLPATLRMDRSLAREDTRSEAGRWIRDRVPPGVPIVWLGEPESEPQWQEGASSIQRRMAYVVQRYGSTAASVIDRPYRLVMRSAAAQGTDAREVHRNPGPEAVEDSRICVVQAAYPLPMVSSDPHQLQTWTRGRILAQTLIGPELGPERRTLDPSDAWFLPLHVWEARQPGPQLKIFVVERGNP